MKSQPKGRILLLEDDSELQELITEYYAPRGYEIIAHTDPTVPLQQMENSRDPQALFDLILTDLKMPRMDGMELIARVKKLAPQVPIILMTAHSSVEIAIKAIEAGAYDFVVKPLHFAQLNITIERALKMKQVVSDNQELRSRVKAADAVVEGVVGKSASIKAVFDLAKRVSSSTANVMITGESGTGKEVVARTIHQQGIRKKGPFVAINCSAIPEQLLESELFGYGKGAFTGAADKKVGLFEEAEGGTLFLDEIGDLSMPLQAKLLRVIQERKIKRLGENVFRDIDVRLIAATHKDLMTEVREKRFREDLFFRLNVIPLHIPPLRERKEDILPLAEYFVRRFSAQSDSPARVLSRQAMDHLLRMPWRGNVRELENAIERAVVLCEDREINVKDLPITNTDAMSPIGSGASASSSTSDTTAGLMNGVAERTSLPSLDDFTLEYVRLVLARVGGVKEQAARVLKIDRKTLYRRIEDIKRLDAGNRPVSAPGAIYQPATEVSH